MFRYHISYKDHLINDKFLRGTNIYLNEDDIIKAIQKFQETFPTSCEILGVIKNIE